MSTLPDNFNGVYFDVRIDHCNQTCTVGAHDTFACSGIVDTEELRPTGSWRVQADRMKLRLYEELVSKRRPRVVEPDKRLLLL